MDLTAIGITTDPDLTVWSRPFGDMGELEQNREAAKNALEEGSGIEPERILIIRNNQVADDFNCD